MVFLLKCAGRSAQLIRVVGVIELNQRKVYAETKAEPLRDVPDDVVALVDVGERIDGVEGVVPYQVVVQMQAGPVVSGVEVRVNVADDRIVTEQYVKNG